MQEKSIFLAKNQQVKREEMRERWGLTEKEEVIAWNYEENSAGLRVFFETPVWKSVKYERAYLHAYDTVSDARKSIMEYMDWYNQKRPHSRLGKKTPDEAYAERMSPVGVAV